MWRIVFYLDFFITMFQLLIVHIKHEKVIKASCCWNIDIHTEIGRIVMDHAGYKCVVRSYSPTLMEVWISDVGQVFQTLFSSGTTWPDIPVGQTVCARNIYSPVSAVWRRPCGRQTWHRAFAFRSPSVGHLSHPNPDRRHHWGLKCPFLGQYLSQLRPKCH